MSPNSREAEALKEDHLLCDMFQQLQRKEEGFEYQPALIAKQYVPWVPW